MGWPPRDALTAAEDLNIREVEVRLAMLGAIPGQPWPVPWGKWHHSGENHGALGVTCRWVYDKRQQLCMYVHVLL